ncbi:MAG: UTP--glucose-1-phosphate uridylyltransferase [Phycisphaerae bacterium]|nr:UTP--glucose-1-phosphate uridylyltransferase [Phycisphaerae bacterium]
MAVNADELAARFRGAGQGHVFRFLDELSHTQREALLGQLAAIDLDQLRGWIRDYVKSKPTAGIAADVRPAPYYARGGGTGSGSWDAAAYRARGEGLVHGGKVAAFTVAGGQGSRLGFEGPKGCYPGGGVTGKPLFACLAEWILAAQRRWCGRGRVIPWYIMTSPINHAATIAFFREHGFFGMRDTDVMFFPQGVVPSLEIGTGRLLLSGKGEIAVNPDGHGGSLRALAASGAIADMRRRGVEHLSYTQIDNPLVRVIDPVFLGLHAFAPDSSAEMSSKMIPKAYAGEKVGVFCEVAGRTSIVEYSDLPTRLLEELLPDGRLRFVAGSPAIHVLGVSFVERLNSGGQFRMPWHRAEKKIPCIDPDTGTWIEPVSPNGVKLEAFVFDALPLCERSIVLETDRVDEFAPIKNADGVDSPASCRELQTERAARWLERSGNRVPRRSDGKPDAVLELSPLRALDPEDLRGAGIEVRPGERRAF